MTEEHRRWCPAKHGVVAGAASTRYTKDARVQPPATFLDDTATAQAAAAVRVDQKYVVEKSADDPGHYPSEAG